MKPHQLPTIEEVVDPKFLKEWEVQRTRYRFGLDDNNRELRARWGLSENAGNKRESRSRYGNNEYTLREAAQ